MSQMTQHSAIDVNVDYYLDNPEMFTPAKIQKETWLPQKVRNRIIIALAEATGYGEAKRRSRERRRQEMQFEQGETPRPPRRRFIFILDKNKVSHKVDSRTHKFVRLNASERKRRSTIVDREVNTSSHSGVKSKAAKGSP